MDKDLVKKTAFLYIDLSEGEDFSNVGYGEKLKKEQKNKLDILKKVVKEVEQVEDFLVVLKEIVKEHKNEFAINFAEPYEDDFINILLLDLFKKKLIDKKKFGKLKEEYKKKGVDIYI